MTSKASLAIAVAKDVLEQINTQENMKIMRGAYLFSPLTLPSKDGDLQEILPKLMQEGCQVCAKGALLLSKARLYDNVPIKNISTETSDGQHHLLPCGDDVDESLSDTFSENTLLLMECAFERNRRFARQYQSIIIGSEIDAAVSFGYQFEDPKDCLIAIMNNVIENDGELKFV